MRSVQRDKFINAKLFKYVELWKQGIKQSTTYAMKMNPYCGLPKGYFIAFVKTLLGQGCILLEDFWPFSN
jgi:hypothetical protein